MSLLGIAVGMEGVFEALLRCVVDTIKLSIDWRLRAGAAPLPKKRCTLLLLLAR